MVRLPKTLLACALVLGQWLQPMIKPTAGGGGGGTIAFGANTRCVGNFSSTNTDSGSSPSVSGSNTLAVVTTSVDNNKTLTATWGGVSMTEDAGASTLSGGTRVQTFHLVAPAAGVSTVVITTTSGNWTTGAFANCTYFTGVNQSTPIDNSTATTAAASSSHTFSITTSADNSWVIDNVLMLANGSTLTAQSPSVNLSGGTNSNWGWKSSYFGPQTPASSVNMAWTSVNSATWAWGAISIKP